MAVDSTTSERDARAARRSAARTRTIAGLVVSVLSLGACAWWASRQAAPRFPADAEKLMLVGLGVAIYALSTAARGWRWHRILVRAGVDHSRGDAFGLTIVGYMGNTVLPARGGELLRILLLGEHSTSRRREILGTVLPERVLDAAALAALFVLLSFAASRDSPTGSAPALVAAVALALGIVALFGYLALRRRGRFARFADRVRPIARGSRLLATPAGAGLGALTVLVWCLDSFIFWLIARSLDVHLSLVQAIVTVVLASFFALIPAAPGYVGTFDAALLFSLKAMSVGSADALGIALLFRFVIFVPITAVGLVLMLTRYGGLRHIGAFRDRVPPAGVA